MRQVHSVFVQVYISNIQIYTINHLTQKEAIVIVVLYYVGGVVLPLPKTSSWSTIVPIQCGVGVIEGRSPGSRFSPSGGARRRGRHILRGLLCRWLLVHVGYRLRLIGGQVHARTTHSQSQSKRKSAMSHIYKLQYTVFFYFSSIIDNGSTALHFISYHFCTEKNYYHVMLIKFLLLIHRIK